MAQLRHLGEFEILQSFLVVAEELNFRRAAERLNIDQSALTRRIQNLEHELGFTLFYRTTRSVSLSEAGRVFFEENHRLLDGLRGSIERARRAAEGKSGRLRLSHMAFATTEVMPRAVKAFHDAYPDVAIELVHSRTQAQKLALARHEVDAGFIIGPFAHADFDGVTVARERLYAVLPTDHALAARNEVRLSDLAACRFVLGTMQEWDFYRWRLNDIFAGLGLAVSPAFEASNALGLLGLVAAGLGVSIFPEGIAQLRDRGVAARPIADCAETIDTMLVWSRAHTPPHLVNFIATCRAAFNI
jgi:DNA-binding transcriptional LysR family regulator